jgi:hypothetical protein
MKSKYFYCIQYAYVLLRRATISMLDKELGSEYKAACHGQPPLYVQYI